MNFREIKVLNLDHEINYSEVDGYDAMYICGGNTFYLLQKVRETGFDKILLDFINRGGIYIGVSAGSIIAGPNIEIAGWGSSGDKNDVELKNLKGLNLVPLAISPHFEPQLKDELEEFKNKVSYPVLPLTDSQALIIKNGQKIIIE